MVKNRQLEGPLIGARHIQCLLCFFCLSLAYALRVNLSVAIVAMTDNSGSSGSRSGAFSWGETTKSYLLSSFFWGYIVTQIPGGQIAQRYGAKIILLAGITLCSLLALATPLATGLGGWRMLFALRVVQGMLQGCVHPATHAMLAKWAPVAERGALGTLCYSGAQFGTVVMLAVSGYIADSSAGWPGIFYVSGVAGLLWAVFWFMFAASTPAEHRSISYDERRFIETSLEQVASPNVATTSTTTPWLQFFTSPPFLALLVVHCTHMWGFWTLLTQIPNYMKNILGVDIKNSALLSSLPYAVMCALSFVFIYLSKAVAKVPGASLSFNRKLFNTIGHWTPMLALIALAYVDEQHAMLAVVLLTLTVGISAATYLGFQINHIDLSPNYAGTLMGITNGSANVMSALAPLAVGLFVTDVRNVSEWRYVFFTAAGFYFIGNLLFLVFGETDVQKWNNPDIGQHARHKSTAVDVESPTMDGEQHERQPLENGVH